MSFRFEKLIERYSAFLIRRSLWILLAAAILTTLGGISASRFTIKTDFAELLPQDEPSIKDLQRAKMRKGGMSGLWIAVTGDDVQANRRLVDDLADKFKRIPGDYVEYMKYHINDEKDFYERNKHLYADIGDLQEIYERLREKIRYERIKNNPVLNIDFDGEELEPVEFDVSDIRQKYEKKTSSYSRYIDGYLTGEEGRLFAMLLYPPRLATEVDFNKKMIKAVKTATAEVCLQGDLPPGKDLDSLIDQACRQRYHPTIQVGFAGGVITGIVEQKAIIDDLILVTSVCLFFVGLVVLIYFRSLRSLPVVGIPLLMGTTWTFGISIYIVEHLNTSTAFLAAIIVGNGINFGLIQLARYMEERRQDRSLQQAVCSAIKYTMRATSTAAIAASIAYGSLIITRFRGFNGFGYMGGIGMILCWISAFSVQPALLVALERLRSMRFGKGFQKLPTGLVARPIAGFVSRWGLGLNILGWLFALVCVVASISYLKDPYEYDFRNLRNQQEGKACYVLNGRIGKIFTRRLNPYFVLADREDQVPLIVEELKRNNSTGPYKDLFQDVRSAYSYLPGEQKKKIRVLRKLRKLLSKSTLTWLSDEEREEVERLKPPPNLKPLAIEDLPESIARTFTEKDGRLGLPVALYPRHGRSTLDAHFLKQLSEASRVVTLPDGERVTSTGVATILTDMIKAIERDGPRAVVASLLGIILLVYLVYRTIRLTGLILVVLFFGVVWTVGPAAMIDLKLNFLNFIAFPITFGIGIDYAVNIMNRYRIEGPGSIQGVMSSTGGAVTLCSLTTLIGYSSLLIADNRALYSFGLLAVIGELASLAAAVIMLPVLNQLLEKRRERIRLQRLREQE